MISTKLSTEQAEQGIINLSTIEWAHNCEPQDGAFIAPVKGKYSIVLRVEGATSCFLNKNGVQEKSSKNPLNIWLIDLEENDVITAEAYGDITSAIMTITKVF